MFYIFSPPNLVRLSFNLSPEYKYLDTNISSNENTVIYIFYFVYENTVRIPFSYLP